jgi:hypothetical protein
MSRLISNSFVIVRDENFPPADITITADYGMDCLGFRLTQGDDTVFMDNDDIAALIEAVNRLREEHKNWE